MSKTMRQIKFRGLRLDGKGWVYGVPFYIHGERKCFIIDNCQSGNLTQEDSVFQGKEVEYESVGQFTGLKDICSCEIYEGDLLSLCGKIIGNIHESLDERESYIIIPEITGRDWQSAYKKILDVTQ